MIILLQKYFKSWLCASIVPLISMSLLVQQLPYQNPNLSSEERAKDLISRLTLNEKTALMCDISDTIPRLGKKSTCGEKPIRAYSIISRL
jgi:hypothetical protein